ncbi:nickel/cobalt transporter [Methylocella sp.]|uniref:nickel/cobalt transporter n=1 Tax=Methylocella sp. TaxID=1978226 RepID=UPI00378470EF
MTIPPRRLFLAGLCAAVCLAAVAAQAQGGRHPFAVGVNEGAASATGLAGWVLAQESGFYRLLSGAVRAAREGAAAGLPLVWLSFAYGVFHAAGPGHGKGVIAAYMLADERRLARGLAISLAASLLQGAVAVALVGGALFALGAGTRQVASAARVVEIVSYAGVAALGAALTAAKLRAFLSLWRAAPQPDALAAFGPLRPAGAGADFSASRFSAAAGAPLRDALIRGAHVHDAACGHLLTAEAGETARGFSWKKALLTTLAAGARPCSGAILVLVFAAAQDVFAAGVAAVAAMAAGVFLTTGALACLAVFAKGFAQKLLGRESFRGALAGRAFELMASLCVLGFGLALLAATLAGARFGG